MARAFSIGPHLIRPSYHVSDSHASLGQRRKKFFYQRGHIERESYVCALARFPSRSLPRSFASKKARDWIRETKGLIIYVLHEFSSCDSFLNNFRSIYPVRSPPRRDVRCIILVSSRLYECAREHVHVPHTCARPCVCLKYLIADSIDRTRARATARFQPAIRLARAS